MNKLDPDQTIICLPDHIPWKLPDLPDGVQQRRCWPAASTRSACISY
jgi:hypothetical protein